MFENLSERLSGVFERLTKQGALSEDDVRTAMREVRVALLEADVSLPVARSFIKAYEGPMAITLFGQAGSRDTAAAPVTQSEWDALDLRRAFTLHAHGRDMLAGDVTRLDARCT